MSVVLDDLGAIEGSCPYPSCQSSLERAPIHNGGRTCENCGRRAVITVPTRLSNGRKMVQMPEAVPELLDMTMSSGKMARFWDHMRTKILSCTGIYMSLPQMQIQFKGSRSLALPFLTL